MGSPPNKFCCKYYKVIFQMSRNCTVCRLMCSTAVNKVSFKPFWKQILMSLSLSSTWRLGFQKVSCNSWKLQASLSCVKRTSSQLQLYTFFWITILETISRNSFSWLIIRRNLVVNFSSFREFNFKLKTAFNCKLKSSFCNKTSKLRG